MKSTEKESAGMDVIQGMLTASGRRIAMVAGRFNDMIVGRLIEGATDCFLRHGGEEKNLTLVRVPGSLEIPLVAGRLAATGRWDAVVCLGAVIRGGTPHFDYVAAEASKGIASESLKTGRPIIFGVLTCDTLEQALERAGVKSGNKGWDAMLSALEMADLVPRLAG
jgi:6,7-dimethyl-8-ribityllumazine synthase